MLTMEAVHLQNAMSAPLPTLPAHALFAAQQQQQTDDDLIHMHYRQLQV